MFRKFAFLFLLTLVSVLALGQVPSTTINGVGGPFNFQGPGVSCVNLVCTFSGSGGVSPGANYALPSYGSASSSTVSPSNIKTDSTGNNLTVPGAVTAQTVNNVYTYCLYAGMACNGIYLKGAGAMTASSAALADTAASFASGDVGKQITVAGAGASGVALVTTISGFTDSTHVTLAASASTAVTTADVTYGTDDTTAFQNLLNAVATAGGGKIQGTPGKISMLTSAVLNVPNTGVADPSGVYLQNPISFDGLCPSANGNWETVPGCFTLDMTFNPGTGLAKINTYGSGELTWKGTTFEDTGLDCGAYYVYTTNTTLNFSDNTFVGTGPGNAASCSRVFLLGGTSDNNIQGNGTNAPFRGYHTEIEHNFFSRIQHMVDGQSAVNSIIIADNTVSTDSGSTVAHDAYLVSHGYGTGGSVNYGWVIENNLFEQVHMPDALSLTNSEDFVLVNNSSWDGGTGQVYTADTVSDTGEIICGVCTGAAPLDPASVVSTYWTILSPTAPVFGQRVALNGGFNVADTTCTYNANGVCVDTNGGQFNITAPSGLHTTDYLQVNNTAATTNFAPILGFVPNLTANNGVDIQLGVAASNNNAWTPTFWYTSSGSGSNHVELNLYGGSHTVTMWPNGDVAIGNNTDPGKALGVGSSNQFKVDASGNVTEASLNQTAASNFGGTCAMATGTSCTITIGHTYTTPVCIATQQSATLTGGAVGCTVSGTTVTITSAVANSETWGAIVFGNPN